MKQAFCHFDLFSTGKASWLSNLFVRVSCSSIPSNQLFYFSQESFYSALILGS